MVYHKENVSFYKLCFDRRCPDGYKRFAGENNRSLRNCPHISVKRKVLEVFEKILREAFLRAKIFYIVRIKMKIFNIFDDLFKSRRDSISAVIGIVAVEHVEIYYLILHPAFKISVSHGQLVKVKQHGKVSAYVFHNQCLS